MTIAGAFWVGVLAARRLRDWGEGRRAIEDGHTPLMLTATAGSAPDDARTRKIRALVADRLRHDRNRPVTAPNPRVHSDRAGGPAEPVDLELTTLRQGDVVAIESGDTSIDGDYIVEGTVLLREGGLTTVVAILQDASRTAWLVGAAGASEWYLVQPQGGHGLSGEPPRNITRDRGTYALQRRGQASAACTGNHGRPELPRVATYLYSGGSRDVLWLERWDHEILLAEGKSVDAADVGFLPGS